jgi:ferrochelatase
MTQSAQNGERIGVLLFNLGGPETLAEVRPFLYNLFSDPDLIKLPWRALQKPVAWMISTQRYRKSSGYYKKIGGGSPLRKITDLQADALRGALATAGVDATVYVGMRYWNPLIEDALADIKRDRITRLVLLPLYPQYSISTTKSSMARLNELIGDSPKSDLRISAINNYHDDPAYIAALAATVRGELDLFPDRDPAATHILFSAHSVPVSYIEGGDPYLDQTKRTVAMVMDVLGADRPYGLSFQSKVGPVPWLTPSTDEAVRDLARKGVKQLLLVPVSFVSEHIETLYELDILYKGVADEVGLPHYRRAPALNTRPDFIQALADLVVRALEPDAASSAASK